MHFNAYIGEDPPWAIALGGKLDIAIANQEKIMNTLQDVINLTNAQKTKLDSLTTFISGIEDQLKAALAGETISPATQAQIDAIFAGLTTNNAEIDTALNSDGTTAAPAVAPTAAPPAA